MKNLFYTILAITLSLALNAQTVGIKIVANGDIGVGIITPVEKLDVNGAVKIGTTTTTNPGTIRFEGDCFQGYDGSTWVDLGGSGCGGGSGGGTSGCENYPDIIADRDLPNVGWDNEYNVGGTGITGDGELCWEITAEEGNTRNSIGLDSNPSSSTSASSIDFRMMIQMRNGSSQYRVFVYEGRAFRGIRLSQSASFVGSTFCIRRTGTTIEYLVDGNVIYTSGQTSTGSLYFDNSFFDDPNSNIWGARPSSCTISDIELCPLGANSTSLPPSTPENYDTRVDQSGNNDSELEARINALEEMLLVLAQDPTEIEDDDLIRSHYKLANNEILFTSYPNPFNDRTEVRYNVPFEYDHLEVEVYDSLGKTIKKMNLENSQGILELDTSDLNGGIYFTRLVVDGKMISALKMKKVN